MTTMITPRSLLRAVHRYCRAHHVTPLSFGRKMVGDSQFVADLQKGRRARRKATALARAIVSRGAQPSPVRDKET